MELKKLRIRILFSTILLTLLVDSGLTSYLCADTEEEQYTSEKTVYDSTDFIVVNGYKGATIEGSTTYFVSGNAVTTSANWYTFISRVDETSSQEWVKIYRAQNKQTGIVYSTQGSLYVSLDILMYDIDIMEVDADNGDFLRVMSTTTDFKLILGGKIYLSPDEQHLFYNCVDNSGNYRVCRWGLSGTTEDCIEYLSTFYTHMFPILSPISTHEVITSTVQVTSNNMLIHLTDIDSPFTEVWRVRIGCQSSCSSEISNSLLSSSGDYVYINAVYDDKHLFFILDVTNGLQYQKRYAIDPYSAGSSTGLSLVEHNDKLIFLLRNSRFYIAIYDIDHQYFVSYSKSGSSMRAYDAFVKSNGELVIIDINTFSSTETQVYDIFYNSIYSSSEFTLETTALFVELTGTDMQISTDVAQTMTSDSNLITIDTTGYGFDAGIIDITTTNTSVSLWNEEVNFMTVENKVVPLYFTWPCETTNGLITFTLEDNLPDTVPIWVDLDTTLKTMTLNPTPSVVSQQEFTYILRTTEGSEYSDKLFRIIVQPCNVVDCQTCGANSNLCDTCILSYYLSTDFTVCSSTPFGTGEAEDEMSDGTENMSLITQIILTVGVLLNVISSILSMSSPHIAFSMINMFQLLLILPMIGTYIPINVLKFIIGMDFTLFTFDFLPNFGHFLTIEQDDQYLEAIGINYSSAIANQTGSLSILVLIILLHLIISLFYCCVTEEEKDSCYAKVVKWIFEMLTFSFYIQSLMESYLFLCISSIDELNTRNQSTKTEKLSFYLNFAIFAFLICYPIIAIILACKYPHKDKFKYLSAFIDGFKQSRFCRFFYANFLITRFLLVNIVIMLESKDMNIKFGLYLLVVLYLLIFNLISRPYELARNSFVECFNLFCYLILTISLWYLYEEPRWNKFYELAYICVIMTSCTVGAIVATYEFILTIYNLCKKKNSQVQPRAINYQQEVPQNRVNTSQIGDSQNIHSSNIGLHSQHVTQPQQTSKVHSKGGTKPDTFKNASMRQKLDNLSRKHQNEEYKGSKFLDKFKREYKFYER